jgi:hypothetical protein
LTTEAIPSWVISRIIDRREDDYLEVGKAAAKE